MKIQFVLSLLTALLLALVVGCSDQPAPTASPDVVAINLNVTSAEQAAAIVSYRVVVTGPDMDPIVAPLYREGQYLVGAVDVPVGLNRRFAVQALDEQGQVVLEGITITSVSVGVQLEITISVYPSVPTVRLSPKEAIVGAGSKHYVQVRVDELPGLFGFAGRVSWSDSFVEVDSAYLPSSASGNLLLFWRVVAESSYVALSVTNEGTAAMLPIVDDSGDGNLITLVLNTYASDPEVDTTWLTVEPTDMTWVTGATPIPPGEIQTDSAMVAVSRVLPTTVNFPDPALEAAVRQTIDKPTGPILVTEVNQVQAMVANLLGISDLTGIETMTGLQLLSLIGNNLTDISPLANLNQLTSLLVGVNEISDLSPLANSASLVAFEANENNIIDVSPLAELTNLSAVILSDNQIRNIGSLAGLTSIQSIDLDNNLVDDISAMATMSSLTNVELVNNQVSDLSPLLNNQNFGAGDQLFVSGNPLSSTSLAEIIPALEARGVTVEN